MPKSRSFGWDAIASCWASGCTGHYSLSGSERKELEIVGEILIRSAFAGKRQKILTAKTAKGRDGQYENKTTEGHRGSQEKLCGILGEKLNQKLNHKGHEGGTKAGKQKLLTAMVAKDGR